MKNEFIKWMKNANTRKKVTTETASIYASAIDRISQHFSTETGRRIDIYQIKGMQLVKEIRKAYNRGGRFEILGNENHGLYRAAINKYVCFFEATRSGNNIGFDEETNFSVSDGKIAIKKTSTGKISVKISLLLDETKE